MAGLDTFGETDSTGEGLVQLEHNDDEPGELLLQVLDLGAEQVYHSEVLACLLEGDDNQLNRELAEL